jgi:hypothetical protein
MQSNKTLYTVLTAIFLLLCAVSLISGKSSKVEAESEPSGEIEVEQLHELPPVVDMEQLHELPPVVDMEQLHELPPVVDMGVGYTQEKVKGIDMSLDDVVYEVSELGESVSAFHTKSMKVRGLKGRSLKDVHEADKRAFKKKMLRMRKRRMMR